MVADQCGAFRSAASMGVNMGIGKYGRRVAAKAKREVTGMFRAKPYDPGHPVPPSRDVAPAENVAAAGEPVWSPKSGGTCASSDVEGRVRVYASANSVNRGAGIDFMVSVNP